VKSGLEFRKKLELNIISLSQGVHPSFGGGGGGFYEETW